jgi:hypothetical protein
MSAVQRVGARRAPPLYGRLGDQQNFGPTRDAGAAEWTLGPPLFVADCFACTSAGCRHRVPRRDGHRAEQVRKSNAALRGSILFAKKVIANRCFQSAGLCKQVAIPVPGCGSLLPATPSEPPSPTPVAPAAPTPHARAIRVSIAWTIVGGIVVDGPVVIVAVIGVTISIGKAISISVSIPIPIRRATTTSSIARPTAS